MGDRERRERQRRLRTEPGHQSAAAALRSERRLRDPLPPPNVLAQIDNLAIPYERGELEVELLDGPAWGFEVLRPGVIRSGWPATGSFTVPKVGLGFRSHERVLARAKSIKYARENPLGRWDDWDDENDLGGGWSFAAPED